jgi:FAD-dependent urate hydroxylase
MNATTDVAIVGAGPYGLSVAAHLRSAGTAFREFGLPMNLWRTKMPAGMFLKSQGFASNLSDPAGTHTLEAFCRATGRPYKYYGLPVSLDTFVAYGQWFQAELVPDLEETLVTKLTQAGGQFQLTLSDGTSVQARRVVVAAGVEHFAYVPEPLDTLPASACTHASAHTDLSAFAGQRVMVVGAGQSALESAALLHEGGATVQVVARRERLAWNGQPLAPDRPPLQRLREPEAGLGSGWGSWFYSNHPSLYRHLPERTRIYRARTALGPAGAYWLRARVEGQFPVLTGHTPIKAEAGPTGVSVTFTTAAGAPVELTADHVIAATGYRSQLQKLSFLDGQLQSRVATVGGTPSVGGDYQSAVPGLYVIGPAVAPSLGPVMRFVFGSAHAAHAVARSITSTRSQPADASVRVAQ